MKEEKFIALVGYDYYPGGWNDFVGAFPSLGKAKAAAKKSRKEQRKDWLQIISTKTWKCVFENHK